MNTIAVCLACETEQKRGRWQTQSQRSGLFNHTLCLLCPGVPCPGRSRGTTLDGRAIWKHECAEGCK